MEEEFDDIQQDENKEGATDQATDFEVTESPKTSRKKLLYTILTLGFLSFSSIFIYIFRHQLDDLSIPSGTGSKETYLPKKYYRIQKSYPSSKFGIDISHHNGKILWDSVFSATQNIEVDFVFIKATEGLTYKDKRFKYNWRELKRLGAKKSAYHFYNPNVNSLAQFNHFSSHVKLGKNDLPPVLDIETLSKIQSISSLRVGLLKWLQKAEKHYGKKPILYTGDSFYRMYLKGHGFDKYPLWIANYNNVRKPKTKKSKIWQFTSNAKIKGIPTRVDVNVMLSKLK